MAKQTGPIPISGTVNNLTFYKMYGKGYVRQKSSLDKERVMRDPNFENSRRSSQRLSEGSQIGSEIYRTYFPGVKSFAKYNQLTGEATKLLKKGHSKTVVLNKMKKKYTPVLAKKVAKKKNKPTPAKKVVKKKNKPAPAKKVVKKKKKSNSKGKPKK